MHSSSPPNETRNEPAALDTYRTAICRRDFPHRKLPRICTTQQCISATCEAVGTASCMRGCAWCYAVNARHTVLFCKVDFHQSKHHFLNASVRSLGNECSPAQPQGACIRGYCRHREDTQHASRRRCRNERPCERHWCAGAVHVLYGRALYMQVCSFGGGISTDQQSATARICISERAFRNPPGARHRACTRSRAPGDIR